MTSTFVLPQYGRNGPDSYILHILGYTIVATAHKIARVVYHLLKTGEAFEEESGEVYEQKRRERELKHLARRAQKLGYALTAVPVTVPESQDEGGG